MKEYLRFLWRSFRISFVGDWKYYLWMFTLSVVALLGVNAYCRQLVHGLITTGMTDQVSWGLYIANFTFLVGVAAGGVMMVIPAYLYDDHAMHDVVIFGEILAIAAIVVCIGFVGVDIGRPDRIWHMIPGIGRFNWPMSMLTWDVLVLNGYLVLNLHIVGYLLYHRFTGRKPNKRWYMPFVMASIVWAISIHTVTAFLYAGLGGRPFWNSALLAPRFLASAFVSGPAFIVLLLLAMRRLSDINIATGPIRTLVNILRVTTVVNLFMLASEVFVEFYTGGSHTAAAQYLFFGLDGHNDLVPWMWSSIAFNVVAAGIFLTRKGMEDNRLLITACVLTFMGVWIEKGMGLIIPGFIPSTLHEIVEYAPSLVEWKVTAGIWALGGLVLTVGVKCGVAVLSGNERLAKG